MGRQLIEFLSSFYPLLDPPARRRAIVASLSLLALAGLEALALLALIPLMLILTAPNLEPQSSLVDRVSDLLGSPSTQDLALYLGLFALAVYVTKCVGGVLLMRWTATFALEQETGFVHHLMRAYLRAPYRFHLERNSAEFVRNLTTSSQLVFRSAFVQALSALGDMFAVLFLGLVLFVTSPGIAVVTTVYLGIVTLWYQHVMHRMIGKAARQIHEEQAIDFGTIHQALFAVKEISVRGAEDHFADEVHRLRTRLVPAFRTMTLIGVTPRYVLELAMVSAAAIISALAFSTMSVSRATATIAVFLAGGLRMLGPLNKVVFGVAQAKAAIPAVHQMRDDLATLATTESAAGDAPPNLAEPLQAHLELHDVTFSYKPGTPVLTGVDLEIEPGEAIGLVGSSGAGKSTLVDLLLGVLEPDTGEILLDGEPLASVRRQWHEMVGYVPQSIALFDDTIAVNVALGRTRAEVDDERVWRALQTAQLDDVVRALPDGIDHVIGEAGIQLSGGQRQRLGIARALYHDPKVLVFDEATSALDNETEFKLTGVLQALHGQVTTITIAHRLSTVRSCDRLLYLEHGVLVAQGTFQQLSKRTSGFARMVQLAEIGTSVTG